MNITCNTDTKLAVHRFEQQEELKQRGKCFDVLTHMGWGEGGVTVWIE